MTAVFHVIKLAKLCTTDVPSMIIWIMLPADVVEIDLGMITESSFEGTTTVVVLNAIGFERLHFAAIELQQQLNRHFAGGIEQEVL